MGKLVRIVFGVLIITALGYQGYGQHRILVQRFNPVTRPAARNAKPKAVRKMQAVKEGFLSKQLDLTQQEAKAFWPVYRKYNEELTAVRILKRINNSSSTADGPKQVDLDLKYESQIVDIKKHYKDEFYKILPPEKVSVLYKSEREFNDEVLKQLTERSVRAGD
ncbi:hypothetical protein [Mucilaginibacter xinganensis]|uniref:Uncharacterized protein n=1 Tax=Mucilaginibacter xinganensis TaxID=1234841 RepID=A0A223NUC3_9SPHI|nr:hypothetical protein [Mucilaginibacter xinganensis]ASU33238.1 hypothetical protein MuYL_1340 [Mucilaginibacter xinganensis]